MSAESLYAESARLPKCFWKCLQHCCKCLEELLGVCGYSRRSPGICFGVCGYSRRSPGICFGVCGSPASLPVFTLAFAGSSASLSAFALAFAGVPQVSRHLLWRLRGVPQVLRRTCWPLQHAINDILKRVSHSFVELTLSYNHHYRLRPIVSYNRQEKKRKALRKTSSTAPSR